MSEAKREDEHDGPLVVDLDTMTVTGRGLDMSLTDFIAKTPRV